MPDDSPHERQTTNPSREYVGEYDKLVRDDIPAVVRDDGNRPVVRTVDDTEYDRYLAAKLLEEATEYADALDDGCSPGGEDALDDDSAGEEDARDDAFPGGEDALDELADTYAVLDAIVAATTRTMDDVRERAREKAAERGGFADGIVLERIEASENTDAGSNQSESR